MKISNQDIFRKIFQDVNSGSLISPRGLLVKELTNYSFELPPYCRFSSFESRKLNIEYIKKEFLWYLKGDKFDTSITEFASLWKSLINGDGSINSNYGQYIFTDGGFTRVVKTLLQDKDSRRASIMILNNEHLKSETADYPCTYAINFRIRDEKLHMSVHMRSQDGVFGMGNDIPTFSFIHEMVFVLLKKYYSQLQYGNYFHTVDSFHVYERHFEMVDKIANKNDIYSEIDCPQISCSDEVLFLLENKHLDSPLPEDYLFTRWLIV